MSYKIVIEPRAIVDIQEAVEFYESKREDLGKLYAKRLYKFALIIAIIIATVIFLTANDFVYFFKMSATVLNDTKRILYVNAILLLIRSYTFIPMAFIGAFILNLEVYYVVALTGMEEIVKYIFIRRRFKSGKWIHNMTN
jgi:Na+-driven multidrug efflux pump